MRKCLLYLYCICHAWTAYTRIPLPSVRAETRSSDAASVPFKLTKHHSEPYRVDADSGNVVPIITDFKVFNKSVLVGEEINGKVILPKAIHEMDAIVLLHDLNMFSISFDGHPDTYSDSLKFRYKLEGINDEWIMIEEGNRIAEYSNLPPGEYMFYIDAAFIGGVWNEKPNSLMITILTPWWDSWTAKIAAIFLGLAAIYLFMEWRFRFNEKQNLRLSEIIEQKTREINRQNHQILEKNRELKVLNHDLEENLNEKQKVLRKLEQAQEQLIESEKMASIGVLTAGLAHELNNPLNIIGGVIGPVKKDIEDLKRIIGKNEDAEMILTEIENLLENMADGATKATQVVHNLLDISPKSNIDQNLEIDLKELIETTTVLIKKGNYHINFEEKLGGDLFINGNPIEINQVIINLIRNSVDAVGKMDDGKIELVGFREGKHVILKVIDNGMGIDEKVKHQIFDPFFTTKAPGHGTGLGLYLSHSIIKKHSGKIEVKSQPGHTEFIITLQGSR